MFVQRPSLLDDAIHRSGIDVTVEELGDQVDAVVPLDSHTVRVQVRRDSAAEAMALTNATADALVRELTQDSPTSPADVDKVDAVVAVRAELPSSNDTPRMSLHLAAGSFFGMITGVLATFMGAVTFTRGRMMVRSSTVGSTRVMGARHLAWTAMVAATIPWRTNTFYESGADPVVLAKAAISFLALGISFWAYRRAPRRHFVPATPLLLLSAYFATTLIGGLANDTLMPSVVVTVRVFILMAAITFLVIAHGHREATHSFMQVLGLTAVLGAVSGLPSFTGRLGGSFPPLNPNALAFIAAAVAIWLMAGVLAGRDSSWGLLAVIGCFVIVFLTGSRSAMAALCVAILLMFFRITALRRVSVAVAAISLPIVTYLLVGTELLTSLVGRGGAGQVSTLSNRTIAWEAALGLERDGWQTWFGQGLTQKKIPVPGQWWDTQLLDSSWISAVVQAGYLGFGVVLLLGALTVFRTAFSPRHEGAAWCGLAVMTVLIGLLESGLFDSSVLFMVFLLASLSGFSGRTGIAETNRSSAQVPSPGAVSADSPAARVS